MLLQSASKPDDDDPPATHSSFLEQIALEHIALYKGAYLPRRLQKLTSAVHGAAEAGVLIAILALEHHDLLSGLTSVFYRLEIEALAARPRPPEWDAPTNTATRS